MQRAWTAAVVACLAFSLPLQAQDRVDGWTADIDHWLAKLEQEHYVCKEHGVPDALAERIDWLREALPRLSDQRVLLELQRCAALAGDGHTYLLPFSKRVETTALPLSFYFFADGLFVIDAEGEATQWIGCKVVAIGKTSAAVLEARLADYVSRDNAQGIRWVGPTFLRYTGTLEAIADGVDPARVALTLERGDGERVEATFVPRRAEPLHGLPKLIPSRLAGAPAPLYLQDVPRMHAVRALDERTLYVPFNQVMDAPDESLAQFAALIGKQVAEKKPQRLVIDVRHNNGGNSDLLGPLLDELQRFEKSRPDAKLWILMGRNTFSAAQIFLGRADRLTNARFAGESSSSRPNFVGEEHEVVLPWSGMLGSISNRYHETIPGDTREFIAPDLAYELTSADYFANRDLLLECVLAADG